MLMHVQHRHMVAPRDGCGANTAACLYCSAMAVGGGQYVGLRLTATEEERRRIEGRVEQSSACALRGSTSHSHLPCLIADTRASLLLCLCGCSSGGSGLLLSLLLWLSWLSLSSIIARTRLFCSLHCGTIGPGDIDSLGAAILIGGNLELQLLALTKGTETLSMDGGLVDEDLLTAVAWGNETKTLA